MISRTGHTGVSRVEENQHQCLCGQDGKSVKCDVHTNCRRSSLKGPSPGIASDRERALILLARREWPVPRLLLCSGQGDRASDPRNLIDRTIWDTVKRLWPMIANRARALRRGARCDY